MAKLRHILTAFFGGELSPFMGGRSDTEQYAFGLSKCENWMPFNEGPLVKRPGFMMIRPAAPTSTWLTAFRRGVSQEYVIEWGEETARFFTNGGRIETGGVAYEIATPYAAADVAGLCQQQSGDRLYLTHRGYAPGALRRDSATTFAHEVLGLENGPFTDGNSDKAVTVTASASSGAVTLTASDPIFEAGHVGALFRLEAADFGNVPAWEAGMKGIVVGDYCYNEGKVYQAATAGRTGQVQPTHSDGSYYDGSTKQDELNDKGPWGVKWTYVHDRFGIARITAVASATSASATVLRRLPGSVTSVPVWRWSHQAFSAALGWPHLVALWKGRLNFFKDYDIFGPVVGDYAGGRVNFAEFTDAGRPAVDLAFRRTMAIEDEPLWVARDRKLMLGLPTREIAVGPVNASQALSGENIEADDQSFYGSEAITPVQMGTETIFVERGGRRVRSADFDFARDRYDAADLTAAARHISTGGLLQLACQRGPQAMVLAVRGDGQIVVHPKSRLEIKGFARAVLGGGARALSAVSIYGADGRTEELWALVERETAAGATVREIWKQTPWRELGDAQEEQFFVDGGVRIEAAAAQTTFTGLTHLAGQSVAVLAAGGVVPGRAVDADGVLELPVGSVPKNRAFIVIVGLAYTAEAIGMRPEIQVNGQSSQGRRQRLIRIVTRILETVGIKIGAPDGPLEEIIDRAGNSQMDAPIPLQSGDFGGEVDAQFDRNGVPRWVSDGPLAAIVLSAMLNVDVDGGDV